MGPVKGAAARGRLQIKNANSHLLFTKGAEYGSHIVVVHYRLFINGHGELVFAGVTAVVIGTAA